MSHSPRGPSAGSLVRVPTTARAAGAGALRLPETRLPPGGPGTQGARSLGALLSPSGLGSRPALGQRCPGVQGVQPSRQGRGRAAGSVPGSRGLTGALCTGLGARYLRNNSYREQKLDDIRRCEWGPCCAGGQGTGPGQGAAMPGPPPGKRFRGRGHVRGTWRVPEQQLPAGLLVSSAPPGQGKRRVGLA